jgi:hypothetical protein
MNLTAEFGHSFGRPFEAGKAMMDDPRFSGIDVVEVEQVLAAGLADADDRIGAGEKRPR